MRLAFMGSPISRCPPCARCTRPGTTSPPSTASRHARPGAASARPPARCIAPRSTSGCRCARPRALKRDTAEHAAFAALDLDAAVVAAYGLILPPAMLEAPRRGCLNIHASLLPRWRGAAPIHAAILAGDDASGITIMRMDEGLDTGPMLLAEARADRCAYHGGRIARHAGRTRRAAGAARARRRPARRGAARGGRHLRPETHQTRWPARLDAGCGGAGAPGAGAEPLARHLLRAWRGGHPRARRRRGGRRWARRARCSTMPGWSPAGRARCGCGGCSGPGGRRWTPPSSCAASRCRAVRCWADAILRADAGVRRRALRGLAAPGAGALDPAGDRGGGGAAQWRRGAAGGGGGPHRCRRACRGAGGAGDARDRPAAREAARGGELPHPPAPQSR